MVVAAVIAGMFVGCGLTLAFMQKEADFWEVNRTQDEIRLEIDRIDKERLDLESLLQAVENAGMEVERIVVSIDGKEYSRITLRR